MKLPASSDVHGCDAREQIIRSCCAFLFGACSFLAGNAFASGYCDNSFRSESYFCKDHPTIKNAILVASASPQESVEDPENEDLDLDVALIDTRTQETIAHGVFKAKIPNGGGVRFNGITLDTGEYLVSPKLQAFGVRVWLHMNMTETEELNLFVVRGKSIVSVLSGATIHAGFSNKAPDCRLQMREIKRTLTMDRALNEGFYDILVTERVTDTDLQEDKSGECRSVETWTENNKYRLKFDGKEYRIPSEMMELDCRVC